MKVWTLTSNVVIRVSYMIFCLGEMGDGNPGSHKIKFTCLKLFIRL